MGSLCSCIATEQERTGQRFLSNVHLAHRREKKAKVEKEEANELKDEIKEEDGDEEMGSEPEAEAKDDPEEHEIRILKHELETLSWSWNMLAPPFSYCVFSPKLRLPPFLRYVTPVHLRKKLAFKDRSLWVKDITWVFDPAAHLASPGSFKVFAFFFIKVF